ncbi:MAG: zinc ribbon domain-containing protein [Pseudomonadales bacterium]|nr:zinc ribbon domain-containing protein [Pseudomonadales bacterium]
MPIYEYQCGSCGHRVEVLQKINDQPVQQCPECDQPELVRLVSASSFRLKGGGWYETDFKTGNKRHGTQPASTEAGSAAAGTAAVAKTETSNKKPAPAA